MRGTERMLCVHLDDLLDAFRRTIERRAQLSPAITMLTGEPETLSNDELQPQV